MGSCGWNLVSCYVKKTFLGSALFQNIESYIVVAVSHLLERFCKIQDRAICRADAPSVRKKGGADLCGTAYTGPMLAKTPVP